jgi:hypothetical protein
VILGVELGENNTVAVLVEPNATPSRTMSSSCTSAGSDGWREAADHLPRGVVPPLLGVVDWGQSGNRSTYPIAHSVRETERPAAMIVLGIILLVAGFLLKISILWTIGIILLVIGVVLAILGSAGRPVGGRRHYF